MVVAAEVAVAPESECLTLSNLLSSRVRVQGSHQSL